MKNLTNYKCNDQRTTTFNTLETWRNRKGGVTIRKKWVIDITKKEAEWLYKELGRQLGEIDWKEEVIKDKKNYGL